MNPPSDHHTPVNNRRRWLITIGAGTLAILAISASMLAWRIASPDLIYATDADTIRQPLADSRLREVLWQPPKRLSDTLNTAGEDYEPRLSWDGLTLFFVRGKAGENADIFTATRTATGWSTPTAITEINTPADELGPTPSHDGRRLYFYSDRENGIGGYDIWVAQCGADGWLTPTNLGPAINSEFNDYGPAEAPDGSTLYFSSNRPQPTDARQPPPAAWPATVREERFIRTYDLFRASQTAQGWSAAAPFAELNTPANEGAICVSPVGDFLYWASDRPGGFGGFDIYRCRLAAGAPREIVNLGPPINTVANELDPGLTQLGFGLFFSSNRIRSSGPALSLTTAAAEHSADPDAPDYDLYVSDSREVFRERVPQSIDWAALVARIWPWLLTLLSAALLTLLLWKLMGEARRRKLTLLARCALASLLLHALMMMLFSVWSVGVAIADAVRGSGGIHVTLASSGDGSTDVSSQLFASLTSFDTPGFDTLPLDRAQTERSIAPQDASVNVTVALSPVSLDTKSLSRVEAPDAPTAQPVRSPDVSLAAPPTPSAPLAIASPRDSPSPSAIAEPQREFRNVERSDIPRSKELFTPPRIAPKAELAPMASMNAPAEPSLAAAPSTADAAPSTHALINPSITELSSAVAAPQVAVQMPSDAAAPAASIAERRETALAPLNTATSRPSIERAPPSGIASQSPFVKITPTPLSPPTAHATSIADTPASASRDAPIHTPSGSANAVPSAPNAADQIAPAAIIAVALPGDSSSKTAAGAERPSAGSPVAAEQTHAGRAGIVAAPRGSAIGNPAVQLAPESPSATHVTGDSLIDARTASSDAPAGDKLAARPPAGSPAGTFSAIPSPPALRLGIPTETQLPPEYVQRAPEKRQQVLERMGGTQKTEQAVNAALAWLSKVQSADGRWDGLEFNERCRCGGETEYEIDTALTGLSLLCFLGAGHTHAKDGPYRQTVDSGVHWLMKQQKPDGDLRRGQETMYSHGIASIALSEAYGMTKDPALEPYVRRAIDFILKARNSSTGGWRYEPGQDGDTSVLGWQVMALKSASMAGIALPANALTLAESWLRTVSARGGTSEQAIDGVFAYMPGQGPNPAMTAEGMFILQMIGTPAADPRLDTASRHLLTRLPEWPGRANTYYWYYATLALFQRHDERWERWNDALLRALLPNQRRDTAAAGSWDPAGEWVNVGGRVYQTAICTLMLEVYYRYLPLYSTDLAASAAPHGQP